MIKPNHPKRRYLAIQVISETSFSGEDLLKTVQGMLLKLYGEYGLSRSGLRLLEFHSVQGEGILTCNHDFMPQMRSTLAAVRTVAGKPVIPQVLGVSGTVKRLRRKFMEGKP